MVSELTLIIIGVARISAWCFGFPQAVVEHKISPGMLDYYHMKPTLYS